MTEEAPPDVKRRRLPTADSSLQGVICLSDLPSGILAHAASFLAAPSRALFAIALDENSVITPNERSSVIVGNHWDTLDFGEIEKEVAEKLSDPDIERVLQCIDAANKLKRLKLTNCVAITGVGLEPLRGSLIIEQIDLSLVGNESPDIDPEPPMSCENVLPILDRIIGREDCVLMHLHFPSVWQKEPSDDSEFHAFIGRYSRMRRNRGTVSCLHCNRSLPPNGDNWIGTATVGTDYYGIQLHTCYDCLKHYCYDCNIDGNEEDSFFMLYECRVCKRDYCNDCSVMTECSVSGCYAKICTDCSKNKCVKCDEEFCSECVAEQDESVRKCEYCDGCYCRKCYECIGGSDVEIHTCYECDVKCCKDCRLQRYRRGQLNCAQCITESVAMAENLAREQLQENYDELKVEVEAMRRENKKS